MGNVTAAGAGGPVRVPAVHAAFTAVPSKKGKRLFLSKVSKKVRVNRFEKWSHEDLEAALDELQTGDIILTSSNHSYGRLARLYLNSQWDHVAVVVRHRPGKRLGGSAKEVDAERYRKYVPCSQQTCKCFDMGKHSDLELFESTGHGVHLYNFYERLFVDPEFVDRYEVVAIRRLDADITEEMLESAERFIAEVRGSLFETNKKEQRQSALRRKTKEEDLSTVFCSELVAEFYQQMGLLTEDIHSNNYLPPDFSTERSSFLKLTQGSLSDEIIIKARPQGRRAPKRNGTEGDGAKEDQAERDEEEEKSAKMQATKGNGATAAARRAGTGERGPGSRRQGDAVDQSQASPPRNSTQNPRGDAGKRVAPQASGAQKAQPTVGAQKARGGAGQGGRNAQSQPAPAPSDFAPGGDGGQAGGRGAQGSRGPRGASSGAGGAGERPSGRERGAGRQSAAPSPGNSGAGPPNPRSSPGTAKQNSAPAPARKR